MCPYCTVATNNNNNNNSKNRQNKFKRISSSKVKTTAVKKKKTLFKTKLIMLSNRIKGMMVFGNNNYTTRNKVSTAITATFAAALSSSSSSLSLMPPVSAFSSSSSASVRLLRKQLSSLSTAASKQRQQLSSPSLSPSLSSLSSLSTAATTTSFSLSRSSSFSSSTEVAAAADDGQQQQQQDQSLGSNRSLNAVKLLPTYLLDARNVQKYCKDTCPNGALQLSVAENQMLEDILCKSINDKFLCNNDNNNNNHQSSLLFESECIYYQPTNGRLSLRKTFCNYLERLLNLSPSTSTGSKNNLNPDNIIIGSGCNAVLENLVFSLTEHNDTVLIPTPYYAAFEFDLVARIQTNIEPVNTIDESKYDLNDYEGKNIIPKEAYYPTVQSLNKSYNNTINKTGKPPKVLLLSHPNNPLGICYPSYVIKECIDWCRSNKVHLISDEIYAGSVYNNNVDENVDENEFTSVLKLASSSSSDTGSDNNNGLGLGLGPYVHFVYALSKDYALSGLRVGCCYTENKSILFPLQKLNDLCQISSQTQVLVERMLSEKVNETNENSDDDNNNNNKYWTDTFLKESCNRIRNRCNILQDCLKKNNIPYLNGTSGLFIWMDLREFLPTNNNNDNNNDNNNPEELERTLYLELMNDYGLLFTPGLSMRNELPGFFRCVFTAASDDEFNLSIDRINNFVQCKRRK